jgi:hypothetical protein
MEALLARRKRFEGPKPAFEESGGAAGPKKRFEGPKPALKEYGGAAGPKKRFEGQKEPALE